MSKNLRNPLHVYGESVMVPYHLHMGREMLERMIEYQQYDALINADTGDRMTFGEMAQKTVNIALSLARIGVGVGDVVSVCSEKRMEVLPTVLATFCAGATYATADITYGEGPLLHRMNIAKPKAMFCSPSAYDKHKKTFDQIGTVDHYVVFGDQRKMGSLTFKEFLTESSRVEDFIPTPVDGIKDICIILFSSGTTGLPKGVPWTHLGFLMNSYSVTNDSFTAGRVLNTREWYYTYGLFTTIGCLRRGCGVVFSPRNQEEDWWSAVNKYQISILQLAPTTITAMIKSAILDKFDVSSVHMIFSSSTPVLADQVEAVTKRCKNLRGVRQIYGMSEAGGVCSEMNCKPRPGSVGKASHGFEFKVVDVNTRDTLGPNQKGEICLKSPSLTPGYIGIDNKKYFDVDGFFMTGDYGFYDDDRYFYIINRIKELIKYNDTSIAPAELESILLRHPLIREAGVCGVERGDCGEAPTAAVVLQGGNASEEEIVNFLHERISKHWRLAGGVTFVEKLPRGAADKLDRNALKQMLTH